MSNALAPGGGEGVKGVVVAGAGKPPLPMLD